MPSIEMYRALGQTLAVQGYAGMYLGYMPWPFAEREYQILREVGYPQVHARSDKRYLLQPREGVLGRSRALGRLVDDHGAARPPEVREGGLGLLTTAEAAHVEGAASDLGRGVLRRAKEAPGSFI